MGLTHKIIALDSWVEVPSFDFDHELTVIKDGSALARPEQLREATIAINSQVPVDEDLLKHMPNLQLFAATGTGIDHIDKDAVHARGITLCKVPAQNTGRLCKCMSRDRILVHQTCHRCCKRACFRNDVRAEASSIAHASDDGRRKEVD